MRLPLALSSLFLFVAAFPDWVRAQDAVAQPMTFGEGFGAGVNAIRVNPGQKTGVQLSDTSLLHAGLTVDGGLDTNVFYAETNLASAPVLRVTPFLQLTNRTRTGEKPGFFYDLSAGLQYREYLTDDTNVRSQRAFNPLVSALLDTGQAPAAFYFSDTLIRLEEPPYVPSDSHITRLSNAGIVGLRMSPGGGRLVFNLRYMNVLDLLQPYDYVSSMGHDGMLDAAWRWLPRTAFYLQVGGGYIQYLNPQPASPMPGAPEVKHDSIPLRAIAGLRGLLTEKVNVHLGAGYATAFYDGGPSPSGLANLLGVAELFYNPTVISSISLGYRHEFRNSMLGNYHDTDVFYLNLAQQLAARFTASAGARYEIRTFHGLKDQMNNSYARTDHNLTGTARLDYYLQDWMALGLGYTLALNAANSVGAPPGTLVSYAKHNVFLRLSVMY